MSLASRLMDRGIVRSVEIACKRLILMQYHKLKHRNAPIYQNPSLDELVHIEAEFTSIGVEVQQAALSGSELMEFKQNFQFPDDYHGGQKGGVWDEKVLEHFIAYKYCNIDEFGSGDIYIDVAGATSPWATILREKGYEAYAIDLTIEKQFEHKAYYIQSDAKATKFPDSSVAACSAQCAYEMFAGDDDKLFISECKRILRPGGKVVISPLYMHTHHCGYSTPEYFRAGYADIGATEYIRKDCFNIPFSRKYSASLLKSRILDHIDSLGMRYDLLKIENKPSLGQGIYCHFILVITNV